MTRRNLGSKRGNAVLDTLLIIVFMVVFGFTAFWGYKMYNLMDAQIQADDSMPAEAKANSADLNARFPTTWDNMFLLVFVLLWAVSLVASFMVDTHPIFFAFTLILLLGVFYVSTILGNMSETMMLDNQLSATVALFPKAQYIMSHMLTVAIIVGFTIAGAMFAKNR